MVQVPLPFAEAPATTEAALTKAPVRRLLHPLVPAAWLAFLVIA
jgi:hypothetical protein